LEQVRGVIRARHYSLRTEESYVRWMRRFLLFHGTRHPCEMGVQEVQQFLTHLAVEDHVAASTQSQALSAMLFLYQQVLKQDIGWMDAEIDALLAAPDQQTWAGRRDRTLLLVAIQTGLRVSELIGLCWQDIALGTGAHVRCHGKGRKVRCIPLRKDAITA